MFVLMKYSEPGFIKYFDTVEEVVEELELGICEMCMEVDDGAEITEVFSNLKGLRAKGYFEETDPQIKLIMLLQTFCGCEYGCFDTNEGNGFEDHWRPCNESI